MKVAICVGHSRRINGRLEGGAVSVGGVNEWHWNAPVADKLQELLAARGVDSAVFNHYAGTGYTTAIMWLAGQIKRQKCDLAIELHFNSAGESAEGHEWPFWGGSASGRRLALSLEEAFSKGYPDAKKRGVKPRIKPRLSAERAENRGWQFTYYTHCPAVICEPFFGSNPQEWARMKDDKERYASVLCDGITAYLRT